ncbi:MAG: archaeosine biosynthesis radical SAM protein RaSEA [Candidatus Freyarchaeota archaeon]|nr:archaeosine biosynthesis radical SAM protein RaSEA [Candidatus Jordarchaeia archaeon]
MNASLSRLISHYSLKLRKEYLPSRKPAGHIPPKSWIEPDHVLGKEGHALVVILPTVGCYWALTAGGCSMCGYIYDGVLSTPPPTLILEYFKLAYEKAASLSYPMSVKIFTSGSFFDEREVPKLARDEILRFLSYETKVEEVIVESRPEFVTEEAVNDAINVLRGKRLTVAIGLETTNDKVRSLINKGFSLSDFKATLETLKRLEAGVKVYLLVKPPFLRETEAIFDVENSIRQLSKMNVDAISLNPCTVHKGTFVELLWKRGDYRPPWLWSLVKIILDVHGEIDATITCAPTASGHPRGPHNCGLCDRGIDTALKRFSVTQNIKQLKNLNCKCKLQWKLYCQEELISQ